MINTAATSRQHLRYVSNIIAVYQRATKDQKSRGATWYRSANELATLLADGDTRMGAGVIAALSANKRWSENTRLAVKAFTDGVPSGHFNDALRKASAIMDGADPATLLPADLKTGHFYRCILDPSNATAVVIDRHAHDLAVGKRLGDEHRGLHNVNRYETLARAYREAAKLLHVTPSTLQATTWIVWRES